MNTLLADHEKKYADEKKSQEFEFDTASLGLVTVSPKGVEHSAHTNLVEKQFRNDLSKWVGAFAIVQPELIKRSITIYSSKNLTADDANVVREGYCLKWE